MHIELLKNYVGWSGHPVCAKRYHFIIRNENRTLPSCRGTSCVHCGAPMSVTESRCSIYATKFSYFENVIFLQVCLVILSVALTLLISQRILAWVRERQRKKGVGPQDLESVNPTSQNKGSLVERGFYVFYYFKASARTQGILLVQCEICS